MALRILAAWYLLGQDKDFPPVNINVWNLNDPLNEHADVQANHKEYVPTFTVHLWSLAYAYSRLIREIANAGTVLLKNANGLLPLSSDGLLAISIIGSGAGPNSKGMNG